MDRLVKIFTDYWKGAGFVLSELIFTNDLDKGDPTVDSYPASITRAAQKVTLTGRDFKGVTAVTLAETTATEIVIDNDRSISFKTPAKNAGQKALAITNEFGTTTKNVTVA